MRLPLPISAVVFIPLVLLCVQSAPAATKTTDGNIFRIELQSEPAQPVVGNNTVLLAVYDARTNEKIDDAAIEVIPWMTMHGHGSSKKPTVKKQGGGQYRVENVYFTMEGDWDLIVTIQKKGTRDSATFQVPNVKNK